MSLKHYHAVWLSDVHLGSKDCKAKFLLDFLQSFESNYLFLVGDIVDLWALKNQVYWPKSHQQVLDKLLEKSQNGCQVIYIPGNHDEAMRAYQGSIFQGIECHLEYQHQSIAYGSLLMVHGDIFDAAVQCGRLHSWIGDIGYDLLLFINRWVNRVRSWCGFSYWSAASFLKRKVKKASAAIERFEQAALNEAKKRQLGGIVCGHIHSPNLKYQHGILYLNDGDWVENCTVAVEHHSGQIELLHWSNTHKLINWVPSEAVFEPEQAA